MLILCQSIFKSSCLPQRLVRRFWGLHTLQPDIFFLHGLSLKSFLFPQFLLLFSPPLYGNLFNDRDLSLIGFFRFSLFRWPVCVLHFPGHHGEELWEVNGAVAIGVHLVDHVLQLRLCRVLPQRPHHLNHKCCTSFFLRYCYGWLGKSFIQNPTFSPNCLVYIFCWIVDFSYGHKSLCECFHMVASTPVFQKVALFQ